jgi:uncharacterized protein with beta-barrel porin domain
MKRLIHISFALLFASIIITSCKKSSSTNNSIVGSWELASAHIVSIDSTTAPITVTTTDTTVTHGHSQVLSFSADNTLTGYDYTSTPPSIIDGGSYFVIGDSVTIFNSGSSTGQNIHFTISGNVLTLFVQQHDPGFSSYSATEKLNRLQ